MAKRKEIEPIELPKLWQKSVRVRLLYEGSRWYAERGQVFFNRWLNELCDAGIVVIPLQFVPDYVGVSREAVLKRAKNGGLTVFSFIFPECVKTLLGKLKERDGKKRIDLVPKDECDQWREILREIAEYGDHVGESLGKDERR
jgi:hypothetical protein